MLEFSEVHGLSTSTDLSFVVGKRVDHICYGLYTISIGLEDSAISVEGKHAYTAANERQTLWERGSPPSTDLLGLLGTEVVNASVIEDGTVELSFSRGDRLLLFDDSDQYESYQIQSGNHLIIV